MLRDLSEDTFKRENVNERKSNSGSRVGLHAVWIRRAEPKESLLLPWVSRKICEVREGKAK